MRSFVIGFRTSTETCHTFRNSSRETILSENGDHWSPGTQQNGHDMCEAETNGTSREGDELTRLTTIPHEELNYSTAAFDAYKMEMRSQIKFTGAMYRYSFVNTCLYL